MIKKVTHENLSCQAASALALQLIKEDFKQINAFTLAEDIQILASKPEKARITTKPATKGMPSLEHNKTKNYIIADGVPCDFLIRLGVMEESGKVIQKHYSKFRQINRYLEIVEDVFPLSAHRQSIENHRLRLRQGLPHICPLLLPEDPKEQRCPNHRPGFKKKTSSVSAAK